MSLALAFDEGAGPLVVLLHGFPELPSCWQRQIKPLTDAGYRVVGPYLRGYGDSPAPTDAAEYTLDLLADDVAGVIEAAGSDKAVVVGHDWGASVTWNTALLRPERVSAVVSMSVPFTARSKAPPIARLRELMGENFFYMLHFQEPGVADPELAADTRAFLLGMYAASSGNPPPGALGPSTTFVGQLPVPATFPDFLDAADFDAQVATFERTGFTGGLNYYRAMDPSWHKNPQLAGLVPQCPAGFIAGEKDLVLAFTPDRAMKGLPDLRMDVRLPGIGHWVQQEAPAETNAALLGFLAGL